MALKSGSIKHLIKRKDAKRSVIKRLFVYETKNSLILQVKIFILVESDGVPRVSIESKKLLSENEPNPLITKNPSNGKVSTKSRTILWLITFWGFVINYMVRCNLNMAIVSMVLPRKASNNSTIVSLECFNYTSDLLLSNNTEQYQSKNEAKKHRSVERRIMDFFKVNDRRHSMENLLYNLPLTTSLDPLQ